MCNFWSGVITRTGRVYSLGEIVSHEKIIEEYNLKEGLQGQNFARFEIKPIKELDYIAKPIEKNWEFVLDEESTPTWWSKKQEFKCWSAFSKWFSSKQGKEFIKKFKIFKKLNVENEKKAKLSGEQIIHRTKLLKSHEKLIVDYYLLGEKKSWDSVRGPVLDSVWGSVRGSVRGSVLDSVWDSVLDSVWGSQFPNKKYPLALPKKIFDLGYIHCLVKEKEEVSRIHIYGLKGKLLKKIIFNGGN